MKKSSHLLSHIPELPLTFHEKTYFSSSDAFSIPLQNNLNNEFYKAYARFPEIKLLLSSRNAKIINKLKVKKINQILLSDILSKSAKFIKLKRVKRLFEIYLFLNNTDLPVGLYHYYLRHHSLETLPLISGNNYKNMFINIPGKIKSVIIITLLLSSLPNNNKERYYRDNLVEIGRLSQIIIDQVKTHNLESKIIEFYDKDINNFLNINSSKEAAIQTIAIY